MRFKLGHPAKNDSSIRPANQLANKLTCPSYVTNIIFSIMR